MRFFCVFCEIRPGFLLSFLSNDKTAGVFAPTVGISSLFFLFLQQGRDLVALLKEYAASGVLALEQPVFP